VAKLLFRLNGVSFEEAEEVRDALEEAGYACYETNEGRFGFGVAGIWLFDEEDYKPARALLDQLQSERSERLRDQPGKPFREHLLEKPVAVITMIIGLAIVITASIWPFLTAFEQ
tara:strand:+ start:899 stop:1243 length:345 start_codon:yes stop_codon:yes gene_type:complete